MRILDSRVYFCSFFRHEQIWNLDRNLIDFDRNFKNFLIIFEKSKIDSLQKNFIHFLEKAG